MSSFEKSVNTRFGCIAERVGFQTLDAEAPSSFPVQFSLFEKL